MKAIETVKLNSKAKRINEKWSNGRLLEQTTSNTKNLAFQSEAEKKEGQLLKQKTELDISLVVLEQGVARQLAEIVVTALTVELQLLCGLQASSNLDRVLDKWNAQSIEQYDQGIKEFANSSISASTFGR